MFILGRPAAQCEAHANRSVLTIFATLNLNLSPLPRPALPGLHGTSTLSVTHHGSACPSREVMRPHQEWPRVLQVSPTCRYGIANTPGEIVGSDRSWDGLFHPSPLFANDGGLPR